MGEIKYEDIQVIIGGLKMPRSCNECVLLNETFPPYCNVLKEYILVSDNRPSECPLIPYVSPIKFKEATNKNKKDTPVVNNPDKIVSIDEKRNKKHDDWSPWFYSTGEEE